jgi:hypoxanthine phosphoribosyltransferase
MKKVFLSEEKFRNCLVNIFMQMYHDSFKPDLIVGLTRGGLVPGVHLSHMLDVPFKALNKDELFYNSKFEYPNVLVIDDINDTGATLKDFANKYTDLFDMVRYAVIVNNESSSFDADYFGMSYNKLDEPDWWVFPWEKWWINN